MQGWVVVAIAVIYLGLLFAVASYGDRMATRTAWRAGRPWIYALTLGVYCTSWTFFGSVGLSARAGFDFLAIYIGAGLMICAGYPIILRIVRLAKDQNIISIADFMSARYGKSASVAGLVALICVIGSIPYIALQLKAVSNSLETMVVYLSAEGEIEATPILSDFALFVAAALALFALLFGTRHRDATEHQHGLMLAVAMESIVKLAAFLIVGAYVTFVLFDGPEMMFRAAEARGDILPLFERTFEGGSWLSMILLSLFCIILLPRQFHVAVVENNSESEVRRAAWLFPLYLVLINLFVVPIAVAGLLTFNGSADPDMYVLALPMAGEQPIVTLIAFIGGLSAATAMVIVACVALGIMVCNDLVLPVLVRRRDAEDLDIGRHVLMIRRLAIIVILALAFAYYRLTGGSNALAEIGLLSFAAIGQLAPAFFTGLVWRRGTAAGAIAGMSVGIIVWAYTLLLPTFADAGLGGAWVVENGLLGLAVLRPERLLNIEFEPLTHGVFWSLGLNFGVYILVSLSRSPAAVERLQARVFVPSDFVPIPMPGPFRSSRPAVTVGEVQDAVARYLGPEQTRSAFERFAADHLKAANGKAVADGAVLRFAEHILASSIGAASSRLVLSLLLQRHDVSSKSAAKLLDDASAAIQYNRDILQSALDHVQQGIGVFDRDLGLVCVNERFRRILDLPNDAVEFGTPLADIFLLVARRGDFGAGEPDWIADRRMRDAITDGETFQLRRAGGLVIEARTSRMPDDGAVLTFTDITDRVRAAEALSRANETLENRVRRRTEELTRLNHELETARAGAEEANLGKTRFLAAASHDILQPLNAARLYTSSLVERKMRPEERRITENIDASLEAVEDLLGAILDISRLDAGALKPSISTFPVEDELRHLEIEFLPLAREKGLAFKVMPCSLGVRTDRKLLRRLLQNLVGNAVKYTPSGQVLLGCRRFDDKLRIEVHDTGPGIPQDKQAQIFGEFQRLRRDRENTAGLGLGLSIVERIARALDTPVKLDSTQGKGTTFAVEVPLAPAMPKTARVGRRRRAAAFAGEGLTIVCIDNEPAIVEGMAALLGGWGAHVVGAVSAREATSIIRREAHHPDLLIVDYHLDRANGLDAVEDLRGKFGKDLPAILITADRSPAIRDAALAKQVKVLHKPVKPAALRTVIGQCRPPLSDDVAPAAAE